MCTHSISSAPSLLPPEKKKKRKKILVLNDITKSLFSKRAFFITSNEPLIKFQKISPNKPQVFASPNGCLCGYTKKKNKMCNGKCLYAHFAKKISVKSKQRRTLTYLRYVQDPCSKNESTSP